MKKKILIFYITLSSYFIAFSNLFAQVDKSNREATFKDMATNYGCTGDNCIMNPIHAKTLLELVTDVLAIVAQLSVPIIVIMIIYSGFLFFAAQGDPGKITSAKKTLTWALVGALIIFSSYALYLLIAAVLSN